MWIKINNHLSLRTDRNAMTEYLLLPWILFRRIVGCGYGVQVVSFCWHPIHFLVECDIHFLVECDFHFLGPLIIGNWEATSHQEAEGYTEERRRGKNCCFVMMIMSFNSFKIIMMIIGFLKYIFPCGYKLYKLSISTQKKCMEEGDDIVIKKK